MKEIAQMTQAELAAFVQSHLSRKGIQVVLSGGAAVSFYVGDLYVSKDIDLVAEITPKKLALNRAMAEIGFIEKAKYYVNPKANDIIEVLPGPPPVGRTPIGQPEEVELLTGLLRVLNPTDCTKDRLAAYIHWDDTESLHQAILIARAQDVDLGNIKEWAAQEGSLEKFDDFLAGLHQVE